MNRSPHYHIILQVCLGSEHSIAYTFDALEVEAPFVVSLQGIDPRKSHFDRRELIERLRESIEKSNLTLISSPAASGKTSLLCMFMEKMHQHAYFHFFSCQGEGVKLSKLLDSAGVHIHAPVHYQRPPQLQAAPKKMHVIILDDAQVLYDRDASDWALVIKDFGRAFGQFGCRIIISAVHSLKKTAVSPVGFDDLPRLSRADFMLDYNQSLAYLSGEAFGLQQRYQGLTTLKNMIVTQCGGLIGALAISCIELNKLFVKSTSLLESNVIRHFLSHEMTGRFERCFGTNSESPMASKYSDFLDFIFCQDPMYSSSLSGENKNCFKDLEKAGLLAEIDNGPIQFTSTLAERFYYEKLFPGRAIHSPPLLSELVRLALSKLSRKLLKTSVHYGDFPKEAVFQHLFYSALVLSTPARCSILPELSKSFPPAHVVPGEIDFYLDGDLKWGVELLIHGDRIGGEHLHRFGPQGKYALLGAVDYAVIDFRSSPTGDVPNIARAEKRYTVVFKSGDYSSCWFVAGIADAPVRIELAP